MYKNRSILGIIPARSGSKGLPGKNIMSLCGKPLISWTIREALLSKYLDKVIVSTDDNKIALISRKYGADVPFLRPKKLATSSSKIIDVLIHAINYLENKDQNYQLIMLLQPTSPLRKAQDIDGAIELLFKKKAKSIVSVCPSEHHPWWSDTLTKDERLTNFLKQIDLHKNRQHLPKFYRINGAIYLVYIEFLKKNKSFFSKETFAYLMPIERSVDIDNQLDFEFAKVLAKKIKNVKKH